MSPEMSAALNRAKAVSSGGFCPKFDGRFKTGRAIKMLASAGYLEEVRWRYRWTDTGRAALTALGITVTDAPAGEVVDG